MSLSTSPFVWYELMTTDAPAATAFYQQVVGWQAADAGMPGMNYTLLSAGEGQIGGLMALPADALATGARPGWIGYIAAADVDAQAARLQQAGGAVMRLGCVEVRVGTCAGGQRECKGGIERRFKKLHGEAK